MKKIKIVVKESEEKILPFVWIGGNFMLPKCLTGVEDGNEIILNADLIGKGASLKIIAIFLGTGKESIIFNTNIVHQAVNTKSLTLIKGVFKKKSSFENDGLVVIKKGVTGADGFFSSKVLLFDDAKGRSMPSLEINENNVKAGHSAAIGRPDENQLFYLRSRGLSEKEAKQLIIHGFFEPILSMFPKNEQIDVRQNLLRNL